MVSFVVSLVHQEKRKNLTDRSNKAINHRINFHRGVGGTETGVLANYYERGVPTRNSHRASRKKGNGTQKPPCHALRERGRLLC